MDWITAVFAWVIFYYFRKTSIEQVEFTVNDSFYLGIFLIPILWLVLYYLQGTYHDVKRLYRFKLFNLSFIGTLPPSI